MYIVYDYEMNEIDMIETLEEAEKIYDQAKQNYYDAGFLPEEHTHAITISKVIKSANVVKDDIDDETGEQYYCFEDVIKKETE